MTAIRAQEVLKNQHRIWGIKWNFENEFNMTAGKWLIPDRLCEHGITHEEDTYVRTVWELMGPSTSYFDAVCKVAEGI